MMGWRWQIRQSDGKEVANSVGRRGREEQFGRMRPTGRYDEGGRVTGLGWLATG